MTATEDDSGNSPAQRLTVLAGPSGVGKGSVIKQIRRSYPEVWLSTSVTTRHPRPGERDGVEYHFVSRDEFMRMVEGDELLEWAEYGGNLYGTPVAPVLDRLGGSHPVLLEVDLQGARQVRDVLPYARFVFLKPPSWEALVGRLTGRGTEPADVIERRLAAARIELAAEDEFDVSIVNESVEAAAAELVALMTIA
ncbi:MAG: guanylate kinase [Frankiaceae bacterium]|nr:guanylate kinase [Frankiaceae bacterium]MDQ1716016.1 guanylate kinase [Frankiaceae bacterium]MDQ1725853.1 guanylate kinase [Frankiaceae bacterium]